VVNKSEIYEDRFLICATPRAKEECVYMYRCRITLDKSISKSILPALWRVEYYFKSPEGLFLLCNPMSNYHLKSLKVPALDGFLLAAFYYFIKYFGWIGLTRKLFADSNLEVLRKRYLLSN
jgi:hypothetical protein